MDRLVAHECYNANTAEPAKNSDEHRRVSLFEREQRSDSDGCAQAAKKGQPCSSRSTVNGKPLSKRVW